MGESLPESVDVIVLGTGLPESIVAAACSRSGLSVLHLDRNEFYGGNWASFNMKTIDEWVDLQTNVGSEEPDLSNYTDKLTEEECLVTIAKRKMVRNVQKEWLPASEQLLTFTKKGVTEEKTIRNILETEWRRFSIDLIPKVLLSRGPMVQTLCDSDVARYAEFKCVDRFLCVTDKNEQLQYNRVPCTKGEIFQDEILSIVDKRRLMKFMTFCLQWNSHADQMQEWKEYADKPFEEFLNFLEIRGRLQNYITDAIGILEPNASTKNGLSAVCRFVDSVGRFGPSPFLIPLYGCGELSQCFCRLSAVFGGLYCLGRPLQALIEKNKRIVGVIADGQRINCNYVLMSPEYVPNAYVTEDPQLIEWFSRAVYATNRSIWMENKEHVSLLNLSQINRSGFSHLLEEGYEVCVAPKGYYLLHIMSNEPNSDSSVTHLASRIFDDSKEPPSPLWRLTFEFRSSTFKLRLPDNVAVMPGPDYTLDYSSVILAAQSQFNNFWPDRDFLPRSLRTEEMNEILDDDSTSAHIL